MPKPKQRDGVDITLIRNGGLSYLELPSADFRRSAAFYSRVLGWKIRDENKEKFSDPAGYLIGRFVERAAPRKLGMLPYFYVNNIRRAVAQVSRNHGEIIKAPALEGNLLVATVRDPAGSVLGLWQIA